MTTDNIMDMITSDMSGFMETYEAWAQCEGIARYYAETVAGGEEHPEYLAASDQKQKIESELREIVEKFLLT